MATMSAYLLLWAQIGGLAIALQMNDSAGLSDIATLQHSMKLAIEKISRAASQHEWRDMQDLAGRLEALAAQAAAQTTAHPGAVAAFDVAAEIRGRERVTCSPEQQAALQTSRMDGEMPKEYLGAMDPIWTHFCEQKLFRPGSLNRPTLSSLNLVFFHNPKAGGTTVAGIIRRLGAAYGHQGVFRKGPTDRQPQPWVWPNIRDGSLKSGLWSSRRREIILTRPTFLLTFVRDAAERCLSYYYHFTTRSNRAHPELNLSLTTEGKLNALKNCKNTQTTAMTHHPDVMLHGTPLVDATFNRYTFMGVQERFDESIVALANLLGISPVEVQYVAAKVSTQGGIDDHDMVLVPHGPIVSEPQEIQHYALGSQFAADNTLDFRMRQLANQALDDIVGSIPNFDEQLSTFKAHQLQIAQKCEGNSGTRNGHKIPCYFLDQGCGFQCLDRMVCELGGTCNPDGIEINDRYRTATEYGSVPENVCFSAKGLAAIQTYMNFLSTTKGATDTEPALCALNPSDWGVSSQENKGGPFVFSDAAVRLVVRSLDISFWLAFQPIVGEVSKC
jgi:hypothetical protein